MKQFNASRALTTADIMNAATPNIRWNDRTGNQRLPILYGARNPSTRIGVRTHAHHCPSCDSIVYSRRHRLCGVCGEALPPDCLFTATEAESVEMLMRIERQRHKAWLKKTTDL